MERQSTRQHVVECATQAKYIGLWRNIATQDLLGAHKRRCTTNRTFARQPLAFDVGDLGNAKVENLDEIVVTTIRDDDIGWLEIAVNDIRMMRGA